MQIPRKMSAHNVMASISRTLGTRHAHEGKPGNEVKFAGEESKDKLYEPKHKQKLVRVLTVVAYIISVSLAAIVLSLYYMYIWDPSDHPHYVAKQRANNHTIATIAPVASTAKTPCPDAVTQAMANDLTSSAEERLHGTPVDKTTLPASANTESSQASDYPSSQESIKSLYRTLTTSSSKSSGYHPSTTDSTPISSISSDQFQAAPRAGNDEYHDGTIEPAEDILDD